MTLPSRRRTRALLATAALGAAVSAGATLAGALPAAQAAGTGPFSVAWRATTGGLVAQSAPVPVSVNGTPGVAVGTNDGHLHVFALSSGAPLGSWADRATGAASVDAALSTDGAGRLFAALTSHSGGPGVVAYTLSNGSRIWSALGCASSTCPSLSAPTAGGSVYVGGPTQVVHALGVATGATAWSYLSSDSTNATTAYSALTGGPALVVFADDQTPNGAVQPPAQSGGHIRVFTQSGQPVCNANIGGGPASPGSFDSSPAVGYFGTAPLIVVGTGASGSNPNRLLAFNAACQRVWTSPALAGQTVAAPAVAQVTGSGAPEVVEEVASNGHAVIAAVNGATGAVLRSAAVTGTAGNACGFVAGVASSVATVRVPGATYQYVLAPTLSCGVVVLDGRTFATVGELGAGCAVQNAPVVTTDGNGVVGVTVAGYQAKAGGGAQGCVSHYRLANTAISAASWPEFHHDPALHGSPGGTFPGRDTLIGGQTLSAGQQLTAVAGGYTARMLGNGQLAVYRGSTRVWGTSPVSTGAHLVVDATRLRIVSTSGATVWSTPSYRETRPLHLVMRSSGTLGLLVHDGNEWANDTQLWQS